MVSRVIFSGNPPIVTDMPEFGKIRLTLLTIFAAAAHTRDAINEERKNRHRDLRGTGFLNNL